MQMLLVILNWIFFNEHLNRWYSTSTYYLAQSLIELPFVLVVSYLYFWIGYYGYSQPDVNRWSQGIIDVPEKFQLFLLFGFVYVLVA